MQLFYTKPMKMAKLLFIKVKRLKYQQLNGAIKKLLAPTRGYLYSVLHRDEGIEKKPELKVVFLYFLLVRRSKKNYASVMELVDMTDSKSVAFGRGGSSPPTGTTFYITLTVWLGFFYA